MKQFGASRSDMLDVSYTDHNREAQYVAKFQDLGKTFKLKVTIRWAGPNYSAAFVELLNANSTWTRLVDEPYENWGGDMNEADLTGGPAGTEKKRRILDGTATRLFIRAERIVEA